MDERLLTRRRAPKKIRVAREEYLNRDGHWEREFTARTDAWPIFEHWASEYDFHLVGMRGPKRLYQKGERESGIITLVEVRQNDRRVTMSAWLNCGWVARSLRLFMVPSEMVIEPHGFWGVVHRRTACRELNSLLIRFNQPIVMDSTGFHLSDQHPSTLILAAVVMLGLVGFVLSQVWGLEFHAGFTNHLLMTLARPMGILAGVGFFAFGLHYWLQKSRLPNVWAKAGSATALGLCFVTLVVIFATRTAKEMFESKIVHHCVLHLKAERCEALLKTLTPEQREHFRASVENLYRELSRR